ncbi:MAG TPA: hypothetical protein VHT51_16665 [Micropepsaceae bacterium]|nr:hypothetical protein [Micropepsaceae bacterium]
MGISRREHAWFGAGGRAVLAASVLGMLCVSAPDAQQTASPKLSAVDPAMLSSTAEIQSWLDQKDSFGPAYTAGPGWKKFMALLHAEMKSMGLVNITDVPFPYTRWYTSEFPDKSGWSLSSDGKAVDVASYGTQSGSTGSGGVTAPMILYDLNLPVAQRPPLSALAGKIVVVKQQPFATLGTPQRVPLGVPAPATASAYCGNPPSCTPPEAGEGNPSPQWGMPGAPASYKDYEYRSDSSTFPTPLFEKIPVSVESSFRNRDQFGQIREVITTVLMPSGAAAAVTVMDMSPLASQGTRIHPTPRQFNVPLLMLDRVAGAKVLADAAAGKTAKLVLDAHEEESANAFETVAVLPGRNFGTPDDQSVLLATHVDGPSIVEDDGGLAILSVLHYYAGIPQRERPKSIIVYLESRHFVPGTEASYPFDTVKLHPELFKTVVGGLALEHFGGLQFAEKGDLYAATGRPATTYVWGWPNRLAIAEATKAINDSALPRAINDVPARPGMNGKAQQGWLGGGFSRYLVDLGGWPGWHISGDWPSAGFQAYYPAAKSRVSAEVFRKQSALAVQLVSTLMTKDVIALAPAWGYLETDIATLDDEAFMDRGSAPAWRAMLAKQFNAVFEKVQSGNYDDAAAMLTVLSADADHMLTAKESGQLKRQIANAAKMAEHGRQWSAKSAAQH